MKKKRALYESLQSAGYAVALHTEACGHYFHENGRKRAYDFLRHHLQDRGGTQ